MLINKITTQKPALLHKTINRARQWCHELKSAGESLQRKKGREFRISCSVALIASLRHMPWPAERKHQSSLWKRRPPLLRSYYSQRVPIGWDMADITLKLIWYRLGETYSKMAEASSTWYTDLDFDSYVLDLLLFGWCAGACMVVITVNSLVAAFGPLQRQPAAEKVRDLGGDAFASVSASEHETCRWFNTALNWIYLHYYHSPLFLDEWIKSLNEQLTKLGVCDAAAFLLLIVAFPSWSWVRVWREWNTMVTGWKVAKD